MINYTDEELEKMLEDLEEQLGSLFANAPDGFKDPDYDFTIKDVQCECGSDSCKLPSHSDWCPKYEKV